METQLLGMGLCLRSENERLVVKGESEEEGAGPQLPLLGVESCSFALRL